MPSNFQPDIRQASTPDVAVAGVGSTDWSGLIKGVGDSVGSLVKGVGEQRQAKQDASTMAAASSELQDIQTKEANFYQQRNALQSAAAAADASEIADYMTKLETLKQGRMNGTLTPVQATLRTNDLLKQVQIQSPHLAKEFRAIANEAKGNVRAAAAELYGQDPFDQQIEADLKEAVATNSTVAQVRTRRHNQEIANDNKIRNEETVRAGEKDESQIFIGQYRQAQIQTTILMDKVTSDLQHWLSRVDAKGNPVGTTVDEVNGIIDRIQTQTLNQAGMDIADIQLKSGVALKTDNRNAVMGVYKEFFTNLKASMTAAGTTDNMAKTLAAQNDVYFKTGMNNFIMKNKDNPWVALSTGDPKVLNEIHAADMAANGIISQFLNGTMGGKAPATYEEAVQAALDYTKGSPEYNGVLRIKQGQSTVPIMDGVAAIWSAGSAPNTGNKAEDAAAKNVAVMAYESSKPEVRQERLPKLVSALDWSELFVSPAITKDIKNNKAAADIAVTKATEYSMSFLGEPGTSSAMEIDFSNPNDPIKYITPIAGVGVYMPKGAPDPVAAQLQGKKQITELNNVYRQIRDNLGVNAASQWLKDLGMRGVLPVNRTPGPQNKRGAQSPAPVQPVGAPNPEGWRNEADKASQQKSGMPIEVSDDTAQRLLDLVKQEAAAQDLPPELALATTFVESKGGKYLSNPTSTARGPMHITVAAFSDMNKKLGGGLDWNNTEDLTKASVAYLKTQYEKFKEPRLAFAAYFIGPDRVEANLDKGTEFIMSLPVPGVNMSLRAYLEEAMSRVNG